jgi:hypothetical protein
LGLEPRGSSEVWQSLLVQRSDVPVGALNMVLHYSEYFQSIAKRNGNVDVLLLIRFRNKSALLFHSR